MHDGSIQHGEADEAGGSRRCGIATLELLARLRCEVVEGGGDQKATFQTQGGGEDAIAEPHGPLQDRVEHGLNIRR